MRGTVINVHEHGATVRLEDGTLAAVPLDEFAANRAAYVASRDRRRALDLRVRRTGRHAVAALEGVGADGAEREAGAAFDDAPRTNIAFEMRLGAYLKSTQEWAPPDRPAPAERHFIRKKRRADVFEARNKTT